MDESERLRRVALVREAFVERHELDAELLAHMRPKQGHRSFDGSRLKHSSQISAWQLLHLWVTVPGVMGMVFPQLSHGVPNRSSMFERMGPPEGRNQPASVHDD